MGIPADISVKSMDRHYSCNTPDPQAYASAQQYDTQIPEGVIICLKGKDESTLHNSISTYKIIPSVCEYSIQDEKIEVHR